MQEQQLAPVYFQQSQSTFGMGDSQSFRYEDVIRHIPLQRTMHQTSSYAYRANQMVKHSFEDGHMPLPEVNQHADRMYNMSDKQAFLYAKQHLNFK